MGTYGVAITVPDPFGPALQAHRADFGDPMAEAIPPHVTLLPPTEIGPAEVAGFEKYLEAVVSEVPPFSIRLSGTGTFRPVSPVVFVQVSRGIPECELLEAAIRSGPLVREIEFTYHPHVTVAHHLEDAALDIAYAALADFRCDFEVTGIDLYEHGADEVWRILRTFPLSGYAVPRRAGAASLHH
jgi:2'-5' RNA ligase